MKKSNYELYHLIESLTAQELRMVRKLLKHALLHKDVSRLFNIIEKKLTLSKLDENEIIVTFKQANFTKRKFELLQFLQECVTRHFKKSSLIEAQNELHYCKYLTDKGLYDYAQKRLIKLKEKLENKDYFKLKLEITALECNILLAQRGSVESGQLSIISEEDETYLHQLTEKNNYFRNLLKLYEIQFQKTRIEHKAQQNLIIDLIQHPSFQDTYQPKSFISKVLKNQILGMLAFMQSDAEKAFDHNKNIIGLFHQKPEKIEEFPNKYFAIWSNYLIDCFSLQKIEEVDNALTTMRSFLNDGKFNSIPNLANKVNMRIYNIQLNSIVTQKKYDQVAPLLDKLFSDLNNDLNKQSPHRILILCFLASLIAFKANLLEQAKSFLALGYQYEKKKQVEDIVVANKMLEIIIFYEEKHYELSQRFLDRLINYLKYREMKQDFERYFIQLLKELLSTINHSEIRKISTKYALVFSSLENTSEIYKKLDIKAWLKRNIAK